MSNVPKRFRAIHHFRLINRDASVYPRGGVTVVIEEQDNGYFLCAISCCSPLDSFVKKIGRIKATKRLISQSAIKIDPLNKDECLDHSFAIATSKWMTVIRRHAPRYNSIVKDRSLAPLKSIRRMVTS